MQKWGIVYIQVFWQDLFWLLLHHYLATAAKASEASKFRLHGFLHFVVYFGLEKEKENAHVRRKLKLEELSPKKKGHALLSWTTIIIPSFMHASLHAYQMSSTFNLFY